MLIRNIFIMQSWKGKKKPVNPGFCTQRKCLSEREMEADLFRYAEAGGILTAAALCCRKCWREPVQQKEDDTGHRHRCRSTQRNEEGTRNSDCVVERKMLFYHPTLFKTNRLFKAKLACIVKFLTYDEVKCMTKIAQRLQCTLVRFLLDTWRSRVSLEGTLS